MMGKKKSLVENKNVKILYQRIGRDRRDMKRNKEILIVITLKS